MSTYNLRSTKNPETLTPPSSDTSNLKELLETTKKRTEDLRKQFYSKLQNDDSLETDFGQIQRRFTLDTSNPLVYQDSVDDNVSLKHNDHDRLPTSSPPRESIARGDQIEQPLYPSLRREVSEATGDSIKSHLRFLDSIDNKHLTSDSYLGSGRKKGHSVSVSSMLRFRYPSLGIDSSVCSPNCMVAMASGTDHCNATTGECLYGCQPGYAGPNCSVECPQTCASPNISRNDICNATSEECMFGCRDGYYGARCDNECHDVVQHCKRCSIQSDNMVICDECNKSFYRENGKCTACNYWCIVNISSNVAACRENDGYCNFGCQTGRYGFMCGLRCSGTCKDICDRDRGHCLTGCSHPIYCGPTCELSCNDGCISQDCEQSCSCRLGCIRNRWGDKCDNFCNVNCDESPDLNSNICERSNGFCSYKCKNDTFWGSQCNKACSSKCNGGICEQETGNCTLGCDSNLVYGIGCDKLCNTNCVNGTCERVDGNCDRGCVTGSYGERCHIKCSEHCVDKTCKRENGFCYLGCTHGWHGSRCNSDCNGNCLHRKCDQSTGRCTSGCFTGWFGNNCSVQCSSRCLNLKCNREDGDCSYGFVDTILNTDLNMKGADAGSNVMIGSLISGWSLFVIVSVVLIVIVLKKRQVFKFCRNGQDKKEEEDNENRVTQQYTTLQREVGLDIPVAEYENLNLEEENTDAFDRATGSQVASL